jgi:hypothetical protein
MTSQERQQAERLLTMHVPNFRKTTYVMAAIAIVAIAIFGFIDFQKRGNASLTLSLAASSAFVAMLFITVRLRYLRVVELMQDYVAELRHERR